MRIQNMAPGSLRPYEANPRRNDKAVEAVARSIQEFGFLQPIVADAGGVIVAGHTRWKAAVRLGLKTVPVLRADGLTPAQVRAYRIADNRLNELAEWDEEKLRSEMAALAAEAPDLCGAVGMSAAELEKLIAEVAPAGPGRGGAGEELANAVRAEPEWKEEHDKAEKRVSDISEKLGQLKAQKPEAINKACAIVMASGDNQILIVDETLPDVLAELRRYAGAGEKSPLAAMLNAVHKL